jgi:predicted amidophosphoribosyltransferase
LVERGYNQSEEFCKGLCEKTGLRLIPDALERQAATRTQTKKGREERFENMREVFRAKTPASGGILLADDVVTTGATLEACLRALQEQENPPARVGVIAIAMMCEGEK